MQGTIFPIKQLPTSVFYSMNCLPYESTISGSSPTCDWFLRVRLISHCQELWHSERSNILATIIFSRKKVTLSDKIGPRDLLERGFTELSILFSLGQDLLCLPFYIHVFIYIHIYSVRMCGYSTHPKISVCWATDHCCTIKLGAPDSSCVTCECTQVLHVQREER